MTNPSTCYDRLIRDLTAQVDLRLPISIRDWWHSCNSPWALLRCG